MGEWKSSIAEKLKANCYSDSISTIVVLNSSVVFGKTFST